MKAHEEIRPRPPEALPHHRHRGGLPGPPTVHPSSPRRPGEKARERGLQRPAGRLAAACLALAFGLGAGAAEEASGPSTAEPGNAGPSVPTLLDVPDLPVPGANPYLSWLPAGEDVDWSYWRARSTVEGRQRRLARGGSPGGVVVDEQEAVGQREINDLPILGEEIPDFGALVGRHREATVHGRLLAPAVVLVPAAEPDGAIPNALPVSVAAGTVIAVDGFLGDGDHGSGGSGSGDFDFFRLDAEAGQRLEATVRTPEALRALDPILALYDATGALLAANDNLSQSGFLRTLDSYLVFEVTASGAYFLAIGGFNSDLSGGDIEEHFPADPFDASSGPGADSEGGYVLSLTLDAAPATDVDFFQVPLQAGDVVGATVFGTTTFGAAGFGTVDFGPARFLSLARADGELLVGSRGPDLSFIYPPTSPLPGGGEASIAYVIEESGTYAVGVEAPPFFDDGAYRLEIAVARPALAGVPEPRRQTIFLDFDGAMVDGTAFGSPIEEVILSPLQAFLGRWALPARRETELIRRVIGRMEENLSEDLRKRGVNGDFAQSGLPGDFDVEILNSLDHADPFGQPDVSRIVFGGTIEEFGLTTIGIAENVDVGNFDTEETAIVLLDLLSEEAGNPNSLNSLLLRASDDKLPLVATVLGNIGAHEAGHLLANFHTQRDDGPVNLMDRGGRVRTFAGVGEDGLFASDDDEDLDFGPDAYEPAEVFVGVEDTLDSISLGAPAGGPGARLVVTPGRWDFGALPVGAEGSRAFVLSNEGNQGLSWGPAELSGPGSAAYRLSGSSGGLLPPGTAESLTVRFEPSASGAFAAALEVASDDPRRPLENITLDGQGGVPTFRLESTGHDFGVVEYGAGPQTLTRSFTIFNDGPGSLWLFDPLLVGPEAGQFTAGLPGGRQVPSGGSITLETAFAPSGPVGALRAVLALRSNDPALPRQDLELSGVANGPDASIQPFPDFAYGQVRVGTLRDRIFRVRNSGNRDLEVHGVELDGEDAEDFSLGAGAEPFTLPPGEEWQLIVTFSPLELGEHLGLLRLLNNDPDESPLEVGLIGIGAEPDIVADPPARSFGPVEISESLTRRLRILNEGGARLTVSETEIVGPDAGDFTIASGGAPFTVSPGSFATIRLRFEPTAEGPRTAVLRLTSDDPDTPVLDVPLDGIGTLPIAGEFEAHPKLRLNVKTDQ